MDERPTNPAGVLTVTLAVDAAVFLFAALLNFGVSIPLGFTEVSFPVPIWQAGIGETVIGFTLLAAAVSGRPRLTLIAFVMSVLGIIFGLSSHKVQGPAREIHVLLVPLAAVLGGLLARRQLSRRAAQRPRNREARGRRTMRSFRRGRGGDERALALAGLMAFAAVTFAVASVIHFGVVIPLGLLTVADPFAGAAVPEAVIAAVMGLGAAALWLRPHGGRRFAMGCSLFALLGTSFGLTVTAGSGRTGDIAYHVAILAVLATITGGLLLSGRRAVPVA